MVSTGSWSIRQVQKEVWRWLPGRGPGMGFTWACGGAGKRTRRFEIRQCFSVDAQLLSWVCDLTPQGDWCPSGGRHRGWASGLGSPAADLSVGFEDVELLLAEHGLGEEIKSASVEPEEEWEEADTAEVLAASWKSKRAELSKLQKSRKFGQANDPRRAFRVEVEEVKKRSRCYKCQKMGHFARDCKMRGVPSAPAGSSSDASGAGMVSLVSEPNEHFVCSAVCDTGPSPLSEHGVCLISSPGFAVLDSGLAKQSLVRRRWPIFTASGKHMASHPSLSDRKWTRSSSETVSVKAWSVSSYGWHACVHSW